MRIIDSNEEYLVDLKWPESLPKNLPQPVQEPIVAVTTSGPGNEQIFQLTGWRGAGWHMIFPEEHTQ
jgi:hypothetical protein